VLKQQNATCLDVISEVSVDRAISLFLDKKISSEYATIEKIIDSYKNIPRFDELGQFSSARQHLRDIAYLANLNKK
jgi:hypothetical protein